MDLTVTGIDRHHVEVPFREVPGRNLQRELPHWRHFEIVELELDGVVGVGERMSFYTWHSPDGTEPQVVGQDAFDLLWRDDLGPGVQIALFDAIGRALDVPAHALLGEQVRTEAPLSWWCIDMPPEDMVAEAERAFAQGYTDLKIKGRPWFDLRAQLEALGAALPEEFNVDVDFNGTLLDADRALPLLEECESFPQVSHFEEPIPPTDVEGNRRLRRELSRPLVQHYGEMDPGLHLADPPCDGFVFTDGASGLREATAVAGAAELPGWLQLVGTGITAAFSLHCAAVMEQAGWPAVNCHQIFEHDLLAASIDVTDGFASIPDGPGLGYEIDRDALQAYAREPPTRRPNPARLIETNWPDGPTLYLAEGETDFMLALAQSGGMPYFERGVETRQVPDDGSDRWERLHERAKREPVWEDNPVI